MDLYPHAIFLTDDSAARLAAEQRCLQAHSTIGLLIRSVRKDRRTENDIISLLRNIPNRSCLYASAFFIPHSNPTAASAAAPAPKRNVASAPHQDQRAPATRLDTMTATPVTP